MKVKISEFLAYLAPRAVATTAKAPSKPPAGQDGYSWGATGELATEDVLRRQARNFQPSDPDAYYARTKRWLGRRVWDCNGLAEGYYKDKTGKSINTTAKRNYAEWCSRKSPAAPDANLTGMPQMPGVAVYSGPSASGITHVGFLLRRTGPGPLDWDVIEAKGADYGVVITPLKAGKWRWWGVMDRYFVYEGGEPVQGPAPTPAARPTLRKGSRGDAVKVLQGALGLKADGIFGPNTEGAVRAFQIQHGLKGDGIVGPATWKALEGLL